MLAKCPPKATQPASAVAALTVSCTTRNSKVPNCFHLAKFFLQKTNSLSSYTYLVHFFGSSLREEPQLNLSTFISLVTKLIYLLYTGRQGYIKSIFLLLKCIDACRANIFFCRLDARQRVKTVFMPHTNYFI